MRSLFTVFVALVTTSCVWAQAFEKKDIIINAGIGLGIYGTHSEYVNTSTGDKVTNSGGAVSFIIPVTAEYALLNKLGLGLQLAPAFYADSTNRKTNSFSVGLFGAYHFLTRERLELYARLGFGMASLRHSEKDSDGTYSWRLGGAYIKPSFGMRTYFSSHIGMFADLAIGTYGFSADKYDTPTGTVQLNDGRLRLGLTGVELSTGFTVKF